MTKCIEITEEEAEKLGLRWRLSEEARRDIEAIERNARQAPAEIGHMILRGSHD